MEEAKKQLVDKLKSSNNILVTVGRDPSVDQLSALLGLTLFLNKQGKHAAAVFSGEVPSTLEFLKPEQTIEKNTDSLRDFIIALDKSKADKLRYKVEDDVVRIFITPYKTSISQDDFEFSQGDFNVDMVVAIGVQQQDDLDEAIIAHGRILHDATVTSINTSTEGGIGTINWHVPGASSLSELVCTLAQSIDQKLLDEQIATAILTGIVAETDRFSNEKTTADTMSASAVLMAAGANQQLVATKLQEEPQAPESNDSDSNEDPSNGDSDAGGDSSNDPKPEPKPDDGTLEIEHEGNESEEEPAELELPEPDEATESIAEEEPLEPAEDSNTPTQAGPSLSPGSKLITEPPTLGGTLTSSIKQESLDPSTDPFSMPVAEDPKILSRDNSMPALPALSPIETNPEVSEPLSPSELKPFEAPSVTPPAPAVASDPLPEPVSPLTVNPVATPAIPDPFAEPIPDQPQSPQDNSSTASSSDSPYSTLADLEESINSPHLETANDPASTTDNTNSEDGLSKLDADAARDEVNKALSEAIASGNGNPEPIQALNAHPMTSGLHSDPNPLAASSPLSPPSTAPQPTPDTPSQQNSPQVTDSTAPPPVPPPIPFQFGQ